MSDELCKVIGGKSIRAREGDHYVNATELCKAAGKKWSHYSANAGTVEFIQALTQSTGIPADQLVQSKSGNAGGTWIHPRVVIHFAQWASADFAAAVTGWVLELITTGEVTLKNAVPPAPPPLTIEHVVTIVQQVLTQVLPQLLQPMLAQHVSRREADLSPIHQVETIATRLHRLLPNWQTNRKHRAKIATKARQNVHNALAQEPLYCTNSGCMQFLPHMHFHLDTAIWQVYREACRDNEVEDFGLLAEYMTGSAVA